MKRLFILFQLLLFYLLAPAVELKVDSISTSYKDGEFFTQYKIKFKVSNKVVSDVADYLVADFHNSSGNLFNWALKDLGLQEKKNYEILFIINSSNHDEKTGITHGNFDIVVPHFTTFKNVKVDAIVSKKSFTNGEIKVIADIIYSSFMLKNATGIVTLIPLNNNEHMLITNVSIKFGWFFNIFITKKRYKSIVEWRIKKFSENLIDECKKREEIIIKTDE